MKKKKKSFETERQLESLNLNGGREDEKAAIKEMDVGHETRNERTEYYEVRARNW